MDWWRNPFVSARAAGHFWFRVFGWGLVVKQTTGPRARPFSFSERVLGHGYQLGGLRVRPLRPEGI